jgi:hypothetical protein
MEHDGASIEMSSVFAKSHEIRTVKDRHPLLNKPTVPTAYIR